MKFSRTYHPASWSQQAREMCDRQVKAVNDGWSTIAWSVHFFGRSYRNSLITNRAAKRFGRLVRAGKVHENEELLRQHISDETFLKDHEYNGTPLPSWLK